MAKDPKQFRPKARRPRGFEDLTAEVLTAERDLVARAGAVYEAHGFTPLATGAFEYADALGKFLPDEERPNEGVFALQDDDEQWMALRYDLTAPLARYVAENFDAIAKPFRRYQFGSVWRNEKPGPGRFREFIQCDADAVGAPGPAADAEMIAIAAEIMEAAGLNRGEFVLKLSDRRLLDGLLEGLGVPATSEGAVQRLRVLRAIDKLDRLGPDGVRLLLGEGRKDESGDFTKGAGLAAAGVDAVLALSMIGGLDRAGALSTLRSLPLGASEAGKAGLAALTEIDSVLGALGVSEDRAAIDSSVVRGLGYYTGPVFEAELKIEIESDGARVRVGSVGGGGRYDDLVARFRGQQTPATGFSFGVSRFAAALRLAGRSEGAGANDLVVVLALEPDRMGDYFAMAAELRAPVKQGGAGVRAEVFLGGGRNIGKQLKYADRRGAAVAILVGENEREAGQVTVKDLALGAELSKDIETRQEWVAARPAQETISRDTLVSWVKDALDRR
jgi:histidyl-tRNA synthetase